MFASPSRVPVNLDASRASAAAAPSPCYPDIAFAVADFEDAFESLLLSGPGDCYVVLLHADAARSWRGSGGISGGISQEDGPAAAAGLPAAQVLLFSGFVDHGQLAAALGGGPLAALRGLLGDGQRTRRLQMKGPGEQPEPG